MKKILFGVLSLVLAFSVFAEEFKYVPECSSKVESHEWVEHSAYSLCYNEDTEQPEFTVFEMTKSEARNLGSVPRKNNFREDPKVSTGSAALSDYKGSGYSRGHMVANGDMNYNSNTASETFYLSNMSPQLQTMNGGAWLAVENYTQEFLVTDGAKYNSVYIYNIPLVNKDYPQIGSIGKNKVAIPVGYFKVMYIPEADEFMCWYVEQKCKDTNCNPFNAQNYITTLERVEKESGIYFSFSDKSTKPKVQNKPETKPTASTSEILSVLNQNSWYCLTNVKTDHSEEVPLDFLEELFSLEDLYNSLVYHTVLVLDTDQYQLKTIDEQKYFDNAATLTSDLTFNEEKALVDTLYKCGAVKTNKVEKAYYSINYVYVFKAGIDAQFIEHDFTQEWNYSELDRACASILRRLGLINGDTYYKGTYYEVFLAGYNYSRE